MADIEKLKAELLAGHPNTGAYNADAALATGELNAVNRPAPAAAELIRDYFFLERKGASGGMPLMGRLEVVANSAVGSDPLGDTISLTIQHIAAAKALLRVIDPGSSFSLDFNDTRFGELLNDIAAGGAKVIAATDKTAILAYSTDKQSRATEQGIGFVKIGHVETARS